jgi:hypothetical protein
LLRVSTCSLINLNMVRLIPARNQMAGLVSLYTIWSLLSPSVNAEDFPSNDGYTTYVCPNTETIGTAYANHCKLPDSCTPDSVGPQFTMSGNALAGIAVTTAYRQAPASFQSGPNDLVLTCDYLTFQCLYHAGGGVSHTSWLSCRQRRRKKRADSGLAKLV